MSRKPKIDFETKTKLVEMYLNGEKGPIAICEMTGIGKTAFYYWVNKYKEKGWEAIIKSEMYYLKKFHTFDELKSAIDNYIDFYNNKRLQKKLKDLTPIEYREQTLAA